MPNLKTMAQSIVRDVVKASTKTAMLDILTSAKNADEALKDEGDTRRRSIVAKMAVLKLAQASALLELTEEDNPQHDKFCSSLVSSVLDETEYPAEDEDRVTSGRKIVQRMVRASTETFAQMFHVYLHEHSHAAVSHSFGYEPTVHVLAGVIELDVPGKGTGLGIEVTGGRCRHATETPIPNEHKAAISVAGHMGELGVCAFHNGIGVDDGGKDTPDQMFIDVGFWASVFRTLYENLDEDEDSKAAPDNEFIQNSGADSDVRDLYSAAPKKEARHAAILKAGEILQASANDIYDSALRDTLEHMRVLGDVLKLRTLAHVLTEQAQMGSYGGVGVLPDPARVGDLANVVPASSVLQ